ncbi:MAG: RluA family pseudouridine synthase [Phycisphaerales bacterium]
MAKFSRHQRSKAPDPKSVPGRDLIGQDGKIDPGAVFRKARDEPAAAPQMAAPPVSVPTPEAEEDEPAEGADDDTGLVVPVAPGESTGQPQRVVFTLQRDLDKRLDKYLTDRITFMSRTKLQALIDEGGVLVNGRAGKASTNLRVGDVVEVLVPPPPSEDFEPQDIALDVLFEDDHLIVLNKAADIIVHPARTHTRGTMLNALAYHFRFRSTLGGQLSSVGLHSARPGVVHRLDRFTTGVIVFAKSDEAHWKLAAQFMNRTVDKRYVAVAQGLVVPPVDVIDVPVGPHMSREKGYREMHVVRHDSLGKQAITLYRVLGEYGDAAKPAEGYSLVEVELKTGRTHQIRVHFSHRGFPLVGDDMYGGKALAIPGTVGPDGKKMLIKRQALHAAMLTFRHPISGATMRMIAPLPADLRALILSLRAGGSARENPNAPGAVLKVDELVG